VRGSSSDHIQTDCSEANGLIILGATGVDRSGCLSEDVREKFPDISHRVLRFRVERVEEA
jgi:hypothetical protein